MVGASRSVSPQGRERVVVVVMVMVMAGHGCVR